MKSRAITLSTVALTLLATVAFAQTDAPKSDAAKSEVTTKPEASKTEAPKSEAQKSFDKMKSLAGTWEGRVTTTPVAVEVEGKLMHVSLRITSMGNAMIHEMTPEGRGDDPITMVYLDGDRLMLTHYCDAGNRPRMVGKEAADGKTVDFEFLDVSGSTQYGHMHHALFIPVDADHHTEEWTYMMGEKPINVHVELQRTK